MHMADALVAPAVAAAMFVCSGAAAGVSVRKIKPEENSRSIPMMGVMGAFVFAAQMSNFSIPGTGSSGHLCGGMLLTALLGPYAAFLTLVGVLLIQCLLFADGGILALGCNVWNMAFYGCFIGYFLFWRPLTRSQMSRGRIAAASVLGSVVTLQLGAFSVVLETCLSGVTELPPLLFAAVMQPIHLAIGLVEGLVTAAILLFVREARPELLSGREEDTGQRGRLSFGMILSLFVIAAFLISGLLSLFASADPDGLEWSVARLTGATELEGGTSFFHLLAERLQSLTSLFPDYTLGGSAAVPGTGLAGIIGSGCVLLLCAGICLLIRHFRKKRGRTREESAEITKAGQQSETGGKRQT